MTVHVERLTVTGGRTFSDAQRIYADLRNLLRLGLSEVSHGAATGADTIARCWADDNLGKAGVRAFPADWQRDGRAAGPRRNVRMLEMVKPDLLGAYPGSSSVGTWHCVREALRRGIPVMLWAPWATTEHVTRALTYGGTYMDVLISSPGEVNRHNLIVPVVAGKPAAADRLRELHEALWPPWDFDPDGP
jgi:hypothetical protein